MNQNGVVAVEVTLLATPLGAADNAAIYLTDGVDLVQAVREGETLAGGTVSFVSLPSNGDHGGYRLINDYAQVAFRADTTSNIEGIYHFTPELHWRSSLSSSWSTDSNWTLGTEPAHVHPVVIDPSASVTVTGPSTDQTFRSLIIGGGDGLVRLELQRGATINVTDRIVTINDTGILSGDGAINADVDNFGTIEPTTNLVVKGSRILQNFGDIEGSGRLEARLRNQPAGRIHVATGDALDLPTIETNQGRIEVLGGQITTGNELINLPGGQIFLQNATIRFDDGLMNEGDVVATLGHSNVFGNTEVLDDGRFIVSGQSTATFFDDLHNDATFQVSTGSVVTFVGNVSGAGSFTGGGTTFFEADLDSGSSPGIVPFGGDVAFGPLAHVIIEAQGPSATPVPGIDHDQLDITGDVTLNGLLDIDLLLPGTPPPLEAEFLVMNFADRHGTMFADIQDTLINTGLALAPLFADTDDSLTLRASIPGDLNLDNKVSVADLSTFALNFNTTPGFYDEALDKNAWELGDFNTDGAVTVADLSLLALNFGFDATDPVNPIPPTPLTFAAAAHMIGLDPAALPEPSAIVLILSGAVVLAAGPTRQLKK